MLENFSKRLNKSIPSWSLLSKWVSFLGGQTEYVLIWGVPFFTILAPFIAPFLKASIPFAEHFFNAKISVTFSPISVVLSFAASWMVILGRRLYKIFSPNELGSIDLSSILERRRNSVVEEYNKRYRDEMKEEMELFSIIKEEVMDSPSESITTSERLALLALIVQQRKEMLREKKRKLFLEKQEELGKISELSLEIEKPLIRAVCCAFLSGGFAMSLASLIFTAIEFWHIFE